MLRRTVMRTGMGLAILGVASLLVFVGLTLCLWVAYQALTAQLGPTNAALLTGVITLSLAGLMIWTAKRLTR